MRTDIGAKFPGETFSPTVSTTTGSAPPLAGTLVGPYAPSRKPGRVSVTTIVSGRYPAASAMTVTVRPAVPSMPCVQYGSVLEPPSHCTVARAEPTRLACVAINSPAASSERSV